MEGLPDVQNVLYNLQVKALKFEIETKEVFTLPNSFGKDLDKIKKMIHEFQEKGPVYFQQLSVDIKYWRDFTGKVDHMADYLKSKEDLHEQLQSSDGQQMEEQKILLEVHVESILMIKFH